MSGDDKDPKHRRRGTTMGEDMTKGFSLNALELQKYQPNRYPFLMIDHVVEVIPGVSARGYKNLTNNESYSRVTFRARPICQVRSSWRRWRRCSR